MDADPKSPLQEGRPSAFHAASCSRFRCIVADPPWPIGNFPAWFAKDRRSKRENEIGVNPTPYKTMTLPEIERLRVADVSADGAHLYLWTTDAFYEAALRVARAWGFEKSATLVWCKKPMGKGMGGAYPSNVEFVLFCRRVENHGWQEFGAWLRERRIAAGKTTAQMCAALGAHGAVNHGGMQSNWETGLAAPTLAQWQKVMGFDDHSHATDMAWSFDRKNWQLTLTLPEALMTGAAINDCKMKTDFFGRPFSAVDSAGPFAGLHAGTQTIALPRPAENQD